MTATTVGTYIPALDSAAPGPHIGDFVWFGFREVFVGQPVFVALLDKLGLDPRTAPAAPSPETAFKRAVQHTASSALCKGYLLREIDNTGAELVIAVVEETKLRQQRDLRFATVDTVTFDKINRTRRTRSANDHPVSSSVEAWFVAFNGALTADDVRGWLQKRLGDLMAVPLRENGGVYWVPSIYASTVRMLAQVIGSLGRSAMSVVPQFDGAEARDSIGGAARETLVDELEVLAGEIAAFDAKTRGATMRRRLETFDALRNRADIYARMVGCAVDDLKELVTAQEAKIMALLTATTSEG